MSHDLGRGIGEVAGDQRHQVAQRRLAEAAAGYLDEGEKMVAPAALGRHGGQILMFSGVGVCVATTISLVGYDRMGAAGDLVFIGGLTLAVLLMVLARFFMRNYAVILTDRRLLVFRLGSLSLRLRGIFLAEPPSEVSAAFKEYWRVWGVLRLEFSHATGQAPMRLQFEGVHKLGARYIYEALTTPAGGADASAGPGKAA